MQRLTSQQENMCLNAEYTLDGETTAKFCSVDESAGITGSLFDVNLDGATYQPCED